jgi:hypothetical protein
MFAPEEVKEVNEVKEGKEKKARDTGRLVPAFCSLLPTSSTFRLS